MSYLEGKINRAKRGGEVLGHVLGRVASEKREARSVSVKQGVDEKWKRLAGEREEGPGLNPGCPRGFTLRQRL